MKETHVAGVERFFNCRLGNTRAQVHAQGLNLHTISEHEIKQASGQGDAQTWTLDKKGLGSALLEEEEGQYTLSQKASLTAEVPPFDAVRIGSTLTVNGA